MIGQVIKKSAEYNGDFRKVAALQKLLLSSELRKYSAVIIVAEIMTVGLLSVTPLIQKSLIDAAADGQGRRLLIFAVAMAILIPMRFVILRLGRFCRGLLSIAVRQQQKSLIFRHLLALPEDFLRSRGVGYFFNRIEHDISEVTNYLAGNALSLLPELIKLFIAWGILLYMNWRCALLLLPFLLVQMFICRIFRARQYKLSYQILECSASEKHIMQEYLNTHVTMKTHSAEHRVSKRIDRGLRKWGSLVRSRLNYENIFQFCLQLPVWLCCGVVTLGGLYMVTEKQASLGEVWAMLAFTKMVFAPAQFIGAVSVQRQSALAAWSRLQELYRQEQEGEESGMAVQSLRGKLAFENVCFAYGSGKEILKSLSFEVDPAQGVFLTGANGSGKSTVFSLLLQLYLPGSGKITINNIDIARYQLAGYRSRIGYIGQAPEFFAGTLRENLQPGGVKHEDAEIIKLFDSLECAHILEALPDGLDSRVAERGENFSGGERLKLALVRELLRDTDWLLCDEAAANLDIAGRQRFYSLLQKLPGNKGVIAIVHDVPEDSDWPILKLEDLQQL